MLTIEKGKGKLLRGQTTRQMDAGRVMYDSAGRPISKGKSKIKILSSRQYDLEESKKPVPVRVLSGIDLQADFELAECVLNIQYAKAFASYHSKKAESKICNKHHEPRTKGELINNLCSKIGAFSRIIHNLPKIESITSEGQMQAYIDDTEAITKNLETFIQWKWDNQANMGF